MLLYLADDRCSPLTRTVIEDETKADGTGRSGKRSGIFSVQYHANGVGGGDEQKMRISDVS